MATTMGYWLQDQLTEAVTFNLKTAGEQTGSDVGFRDHLYHISHFILIRDPWTSGTLQLRYTWNDGVASRTFTTVALPMNSTSYLTGDFYFSGPRNDADPPPETALQVEVIFNAALGSGEYDARINAADEVH